MSKPTDKSTPMDPTFREQAVGTPATNTQRVCWAIKTLVAEVLNLFPETPVEYSNYDGRNTALDVTFDLTALSNDDAIDFITLLSVLPVDAHARVKGVEADHDEAQVIVMMRPSPRTQDIREPFGLNEAWMILSQTEEDKYEDGDGHLIVASEVDGAWAEGWNGGSL